MATRKKSSTSATRNSDAATAALVTEAYEKAVGRFAGAVALLEKKQYEEAKTIFEEIEKDNPEEPVLIERARCYASICGGRLIGDPAPPTNSEESYLHGVVKSNAGALDEAVRLFDQAIAEQPNSARFLYGRASAFALKGDVDAAISDLRQAISAEPTTRFHAVNDPDFEQIREEPAFIDIIEPTPSGA